MSSRCRYATSRRHSWQQRRRMSSQPPYGWSRRHSWPPRRRMSSQPPYGWSRRHSWPPRRFEPASLPSCCSLRAMSGALNPASRARALDALTAGDLDVLVIGGGITGAGAALDAATRGLRVGLVEARDLAAGTSSASSKLIHGGLRYLEMGDLGLVREALRERELLLTRIAPHLVAPLPFLWPLRRRGWERWYLGAGLTLYDTLGGARSVPRHRHLSRRGTLRVAPGLRSEGL